jgi:hypothetical protein
MEKLHTYGYRGALIRSENKFVIWGKWGRVLSEMPFDVKTQTNLDTLNFIYTFVVEAGRKSA